MTIHQGCPFCQQVFEIGPHDYGPIKRHIQTEHIEKNTTVPDDG